MKLFALLLLCGCAAKPFADVAQDARDERKQLSEITWLYDSKQLTCEEYVILMKSLLVRQQIDSILETKEKP